MPKFYKNILKIIDAIERDNAILEYNSYYRAKRRAKPKLSFSERSKINSANSKMRNKKRYN